MFQYEGVAQLTLLQKSRNLFSLHIIGHCDEWYRLRRSPQLPHARKKLQFYDEMNHTIETDKRQFQTVSGFIEK